MCLPLLIGLRVLKCMHVLSYAGSGMGAAAVLERGDSADELCNARVAS